MEDNRTNIQETLTENSVREIQKIDKGDFEGLKNAANVYLNQIEILSTMYEETISKTRIKDKLKTMYQRMRDETSYTRLMLKYQHEFETALNQFLGRTIYLTYVNQDGTLNFYDDFNIGKLYATATANRGRGNISQSKIFDANDLQEDLRVMIQESIANKQQVYQTAIQRYHSDKDELKMNYDPSKNTFYWWKTWHKTLAGWTGPIVNEGPIAEGYADAVINEEPNINNNSIETSLEVLWNNYIGKDSIGAALKGDVVLEKDGSIQFAIKKGSFSTAMVRQYIVLAYNIRQLNQLTIEELEENFLRLTKIGKATDQVLEDLKNKAEEEVVNTVNNMLKKT